MEEIKLDNPRLLKEEIIPIGKKKIDYKKAALAIVAIALSFFLGITAFWETSYAILEFVKIEKNILDLILAGIPILLVSCVVIIAGISVDFRKKLLRQIIDTNYFSFVSLFLTIIGVSFCRMFFIPYPEMGILVGIIGLILIFFGGVISVAIFLIDKRSIITKIVTTTTLVIILLLLIVFSVSSETKTNSEENYKKQSQELIDKNMPACSEDFMKALDESMSVGDYNFCLYSFPKYGYRITIPGQEESVSYGIDGCKKDGKIIDIDSCTLQMSGSFGDTVPYCENQTSCKEKLICYGVLGKDSFENRKNNILPDGSICIDQN